MIIEANCKLKECIKSAREKYENTKSTSKKNIIDEDKIEDEINQISIASLESSEYPDEIVFKPYKKLKILEKATNSGDISTFKKDSNNVAKNNNRVSISNEGNNRVYPLGNINDISKDIPKKSLVYAIDDSIMLRHFDQIRNWLEQDIIVLIPKEVIKRLDELKNLHNSLGHKSREASRKVEILLSNKKYKNKIFIESEKRNYNWRDCYTLFHPTNEVFHLILNNANYLETITDLLKKKIVTFLNCAHNYSNHNFLIVSDDSEFIQLAECFPPLQKFVSL